jgi:tRNA A37 threonylcarbamoyladenosine modification protein TsaB
VTLCSPILIGIYEDKKLIETISSQNKTSDELPKIFEKLLKKYKIKNLFYAKGPGSFMAIKITYLFLKSLSILKNIPLFATDGFYFNDNQPIKAIGKLSFVKIDTEIQTRKLEKAPTSNFKLKDVLEYDEFDENTTPLYAIGAVG